MCTTARRTPEIGLLLPHARGGGAAEVARRAEAAGFDRLVARCDGGGDPLTTLAYVAAATERIALAPAGISLPGRRARHVAQAARSLDELSGGRFALWVTADPEGAPVDLTTGAGRAFDAQLDELAHGPAAAVPLLIAGRDRRTLARVGRRGDGIVLGPHARVYDVVAARVELEALWRRHGRGGRPRIAAVLPVTGLFDLGAQVAELRDAGATAVVLAPRPGDRVEELAAAAGLGVAGSAD